MKKKCTPLPPPQKKKKTERETDRHTYRHINPLVDCLTD